MSIDRKTGAQMEEESRIETQRLTAQAEYVAKFVAERIGATATLSEDETNTWLVQARRDMPPLRIGMGMVRGKLNHYKFEMPLSEMPQIWETIEGKKIAIFNNTEAGALRTPRNDSLSFWADGNTSYHFGPEPYSFPQQNIGAKQIT